VSKLQESIFVGSAYEPFWTKQVRPQQTRVDSKGKDKQKREDDESQADTDLFNLIQKHIRVHFIFPCNVLFCFSSQCNEHFHVAERANL
jgi:hypothetical protein